MSGEPLQIKDLHPDDKPREKLLKNGPDSLSDTELLAIIIGSGTKGNSAIQLAQHLLKTYHYDLNKIALQHPLSLKDTQKGLGLVRSIHILAALELGKRRYIGARLNKETPLDKPDAAACYFMRYLADKNQEEFYAVMLNNANMPIEVYRIAQGNINATLVDVRVICRYALINNAVSVIVAHNHPSGNLTPSKEDIEMTKKIRDALKTIDIKLWDHLIIYRNEYYSFAEHQLLEVSL